MMQNEFLNTLSEEDRNKMLEKMKRDNGEVTLSDSMENIHDEETHEATEVKDVKPSLHLKGHVVIKDDKGNTVLEKDNLIVLRGRVFALEQIFGVPNDLNLGYNTNNLSKKKIALFKAGKGGCIEGQPFNVIPVIPSDCRELGEAIPFKPEIDGVERPEGYYDKALLPGERDKFGYYAKTIDKIEWGKNIPEGLYSEDQDEVYVKLTLKINKDDFATIERQDENGHTEYIRSTFVNEIGLFIANHVKNDIADRMEEIEMFSRICFESEPLFNATKELTIYYYIYA